MADDRKLWERLADWDFGFQLTFIVVAFVIGFVFWLFGR
jgi:hypothetical protein